jgi:3-methyladenine DNA glycosylase AlkD
MFMTKQDVLEELKVLGSPSVRKVLLNHRVGEPCYGVKIGDLKKLQKRIKRDHELALELWDTGIHDARYLAGLIADDPRMTRGLLQHWVETASPMLAGCVVPWVAVGSPHGREVARAWIESDEESVAAAGWVTWSGLVSVTPDERLDLKEIKELLARVVARIKNSPNDVRYQMNNFVICTGCYVAGLMDQALESAETIGAVEVDMGATSCEVPAAAEYIRKVAARGSIGKKRKSVKC